MALSPTAREAIDAQHALGIALGTASTTVLIFVAPTTGIYEVFGTAAVTGASTVAGITVSVSWTDPYATTPAQSYDWINNQSLAPDVYSLDGYPLVCQGGATITVTGLASTASAVKVSATLRRVMP